MSSTIPKMVILVPYRNRAQQKAFFTHYLKTVVLANVPAADYELWFVHQCDSRMFNRGALKNIGFLAIKQRYPHHYKEMTLVMHDVDTIPYAAGVFDYEAPSRVVKHFYGFTFALGGILSIKGADFEATNGYPSLWGWGMEDRILQQRCDRIHLRIDRTQFRPIGHPDVLHLFDGITRIVSKNEPLNAKHDNGVDGLRTITNLQFSFVDDRIDVTSFRVPTEPSQQGGFYQYDLRAPIKDYAKHPTTRTETVWTEGLQGGAVEEPRTGGKGHLRGARRSKVGSSIVMF